MSLVFYILYCIQATYGVFMLVATNTPAFASTSQPKHLTKRKLLSFICNTHSMHRVSWVPPREQQLFLRFSVLPLLSLPYRPPDSYSMARLHTNSTKSVVQTVNDHCISVQKVNDTQNDIILPSAQYLDAIALLLCT